MYQTKKGRAETLPFLQMFFSYFNIYEIIKFIFAITITSLRQHHSEGRSAQKKKGVYLLTPVTVFTNLQCMEKSVSNFYLE